ncbi:hypothetical protein DOM22_16420 [Bdellovibrio sp. ZAP7]|uniref:hypothetical protein n=1 Tax=Bdellovibrio sp. ZAP7 TaxID=2231053 RepID=UPI0011592B27|nr:hypothetical protein [Bdellovibrio sp. ZAP7]QDK46626.1 hypothetical protein DOM22_16420 [Bdellovibrio sp. ZAP7]
MKRFSLIFLVAVFSFTSVGQAEEPKSSLEVIIEEMAKQYALTAAQDYATKKTFELVAQKFGEKIAEQASKYLSNTLAVIGLIENVRSYDEANSESQRYAAASHAVANVVSMAFPPAGLVAQFGVLAQDLSAAFVSQTYQLKMAATLAEIVELNKKTSDLQLAEFNAESKELQALALRAEAINDLLKDNSERYERDCARENDDVKNPQACLPRLLVFTQLLVKQGQTVKSLIEYQGRFLSLSSVMKPEEINNLKDLFVEANKKLKKMMLFTEEVLAQYAFDQVSAIRSQAELEKITVQCKTSILIELKGILVLKKDILTAQKKEWWKDSMLEEKKTDLITLTQGLCKSYYTSSVSNDLKLLVTRALK